MKTYLKISVLAMGVLVAAATGARAGTIRVELDGSGDFISIHDALLAAATGDTVLIGPGRYESTVQVRPLTYAVAYLDEQKSLTILGEDVETVILGPELPPELGDFYGLGMTVNGPHIIRNLRFENVVRGVDSINGGEVSNCVFVNCWAGVGFDGSNPGKVLSCDFAGEIDSGVNMGDAVSSFGATDILVEDCTALDMGVYLQGVANYVFRNCEFPRTIGGGSFNHNVATGLIENCKFWCLVGNQGGLMTMRDCEVYAMSTWQRANIGVEASQGHYSETVLENCVLTGGSGDTSTIVIVGPSLISGSGNHILKGEFSTNPYTVFCFETSAPTLDLRGNYWGTEDPAQISAWIYDADDDPDEGAHVLFEPFSADPLPTEKQSLGSVKSMFR